ncbi:uncharacterized protein LOC122303094 isoform X3 [Carya illinoinensis]|uniref:uncharacterized protein LOC122303094 isoform X3 n=1 Tax=Carya illinoinensis TaxID=32201 RepID=UPI001C7222DD|nr:uncharacterized protein LOC122303094 isoform X3 [Carya illinoinensis]
MAEEVGAESETGKVEKAMEGVASIALLPCGSISGHFIQLPHSVCYGLHGTGSEMLQRKKEQSLVVECRGHDAARFHSIDHAHGWENDVVGMVEHKDGKNKILVSFACETLKAEKAAEEHIRQFMPKLAGLDVVVNIGPMSIAGLDFGAEEPDIRQDV